jgi:hypothetical protein
MSLQFFPRFIAWVLMHLVLLVMFVAHISTSFSIPVPRMCVLYHKFYFRRSCHLPQNLPGLEWLNGCVNLTGVVQWLRLALSKGPNWVGVFFPPSPEDEKRSSFRNVVFALPRTRTMEKVQQPSNSVCYTPSSESFKITYEAFSSKSWREEKFWEIQY